MLDTRYYNVDELKTWSKSRFLKVYSGQIPDIDKVAKWLGLKDESQEEKPKKKSTKK